MSAVIIVGKLLFADPAVTNNIDIAMMRQPMRRTFIIISHVYEGQEYLLSGAVEWYETRVSVAIHADNAIACNKQAEAVNACLAYVAHQRVEDDESPPGGWKDVCIYKAGVDVLDYDDARTIYRRIIDYTVRWKPCA